MSKLDDMAKYRSEGMLRACEIAQKAQDAGEDPVEAIKKELAFRKRYKLDTILTEKEIVRACKPYLDGVRNEAATAVMTVACLVLWDVFHFGGKERLPKFVQECQVYINGLAEGSLDWQTLDDELWKHCRLKIKVE